MRILCGILAVFMALFVAVQYNDPDPFFWGSIYGLTAIWAGLAAWRPWLISSGIGKILLTLSVLAAVFGVYHFWPATPNWWQKSVWWEVETAREGMGMMITLGVLLISSFCAFSRRNG